MKVRLNGRAEDLDDALTVDALVVRLGLRRDVIAVEINRAVVPRAAFGAVHLRAGDEVEIVTLVGGG